VRSFLCFIGFHRRIASNKDTQDLANYYGRASSLGGSRVPTPYPFERRFRSARRASAREVV
jgi:hypothetical protein